MTTQRGSRAYYFGCWRDAGHYFWMPGSRGTPYSPPGQRDPNNRPENIVPWGWGVDGKLNPSGRQGEAAIHHRDGWTALAMADRTVDTRGGSVSVFVFEEILTFDQALAKARELFGQVVERIEARTPIFDTAGERNAAA